MIEKIVRFTGSTENEVLCKDIPHGTIFTGTIGNYSEDHLFIKLQRVDEPVGTVYSLDNLTFGHYWTCSSVREYHKVAINIEVLRNL